MLIGLDFDDVVVEFVASLLEFYNIKNGTDYSKDQVVMYGIWNLWNGTKEDCFELCDEYYFSEDAYNALPVEGAVEGINKLWYNGHELVIITARHKETEQPMLRWLNRYFPGASFNIGFGNWKDTDCTYSNKAELCKEYSIDLLIDDCYDYIMECYDVGVRTLLLTQPWNKEYDLLEGVERADNWEEIVEKVNGPGESL
jgi:uncharacterized HAD superfamily protein